MVNLPAERSGCEKSGIEMSDRQFAQHLLEKVIQLRPVNGGVEERPISSCHCLEIETVVIRVVEEVAFNSPNFSVHLFPFRPGIHIDLGVFHLQNFAVGLKRLGRGGDEPFPSLPQQYLFAVGRNVESRDSVHELV